MFFSEVGSMHSILKEELVNGYKNFSIELYVQNRLSLFTEFYTHHTRFLFVPNPTVVSYILCITSVDGRRPQIWPTQNVVVAPPMLGIHAFSALCLRSLQINWSTEMA